MKQKYFREDPGVLGILLQIGMGQHSSPESRNSSPQLPDVSGALIKTEETPRWSSSYVSAFKVKMFPPKKEKKSLHNLKFRVMETFIFSKCQEKQLEV